MCGNYQSDATKVASGVPQGTILGSLLFLVYINDLLKNISSNLRPFADDCVLYRNILTPDDHLILQRALDAINDWCANWLV